MRWGRAVGTAVAALMVGAVGTACGGHAGKGAGDAAEGWPRLRQDNPQASYFLAPGGKAEDFNRYETILYAQNPRGRNELAAKDVVAVYDLSSLKGKVTIRRVGAGCTRKDWTVTCTTRDFYQQTYLDPFALSSARGAKTGPAGEVQERITSSNAGTVRHTRRVCIGKPDLLMAKHEPSTIPRSRRGFLPPLTPAFGNRGQVSPPGGFVLAVSLSQGTLAGEKYSNCFYTPDGKAAYCRFSGDLSPGTAFETDGPFRGATDPCCWVKGAYSYRVWPTGNPPGYGAGPSPQDRPGTGRRLGLKPIGIDTLPNGPGVLEFSSAGEPEADWTIDGITLRGRIGEQLTVAVPSARNLGPDKPDRHPTLAEVTLPEGVTLVPPQPDEQAEEEYCRYANEGRTVRCTQNPPWSYLRVRIDKEVRDARGTITVIDPTDSADPNPSNNTAPIKVQITAGIPHAGSGSAAPSAS
ncbi:hypothetical protein ACH4UM_31900 [Streptomyces sp. NPDC020801]|uniref:hypothetical protein n=1 Tax=unclassified Streptomyces TaxID=2593676 RepID=UPI0037AC0A2B